MVKQAGLVTECIEKQNMSRDHDSSQRENIWKNLFKNLGLREDLREDLRKQGFS